METVAEFFCPIPNPKPATCAGTSCLLGGILGCNQVRIGTAYMDSLRLGLGWYRLCVFYCEQTPTQCPEEGCGVKNDSKADVADNM